MSKVPIPPKDRLWRHPSEVGQERRAKRQRRQRAVLVGFAWAALVLLAAVGYGAFTD